VQNRDNLTQKLDSVNTLFSQSKAELKSRIEFIHRNLSLVQKENKDIEQQMQANQALITKAKKDAKQANKEMDKSQANLRQQRLKVLELKDENQTILAENETYRKFFCLNMAYTKYQGETEIPPWVFKEVAVVYNDFDLAVKNNQSFIEHGIHEIEKGVNAVL
jgi:chromosome segregation ATPase